MSYELIRTNNRALTRRNDAELAQIERAAKLAFHKIKALEVVGSAAVSSAVMLQLAQKGAEEIAPNGADSYATIVQITTGQIAGVVAQLGYQIR